MVSLITMALSILGPVFSWFLKKMINSGKVDAESKLRLEDAYKALSRIRRDDIKRARELEKELPKMDKEMSDIVSGEKDWPNERDDKPNGV